MEKQTLATALNAALTRQFALETDTPNVRAFLLTALESSTTRRDQIVQRRIGQYQSHMTILK